jgi:ABC-type antimicrobial peptide transport system permease subunit
MGTPRLAIGKVLVTAQVGLCVLLVVGAGLMIRSFALLAVLLSCIGLYGLVAYNAARRTREIGLRMALGATRRDVAGTILCEALRLVLFGLGVGMPAALALASLIKSQLYGVAPADPVALVAGGFVLIAVALLSAWLPARRAARIDPMEALRCE